MKAAEHLARLQRERLAMEARRDKGREEARRVADGVEETVELSCRRGAAFEAPQRPASGRPGAYRRRAGLDWIAGKGRLNPAQKAAGERYGACYRKAKAEGAIGSSLAMPTGDGAGAPLTEVLSRAEARVRAQERLAQFRGRLYGQPDLVAACDLICGEELTPREAAGGEREAGRLEAVLSVALDLLAREAAG